jgi:RNA recognition motif-containing protein
VFVGNLAWDVTNDILKQFMSNSGKVIYCDVFRDEDGRSKGSGIVEYDTKSEADHAISNMHDKVLYGRLLIVREDREERIPPSSDPNNRHPSNKVHAVFVGNLDKSIDWRELKNHMSKAGKVVRASILVDNKSISKGCGIVVYERYEDMLSAFTQLNDSELRGRLIFVREDKDSNKSNDENSDNSSSSRTPLPVIYVPENTVYVGNLSWTVNPEILKKYMQSIEYDVKRVAIWEEGGKSLGRGVVEYYCKNAADKAKAVLKGTLLKGRKITIKSYEPKVK